MPKSYRDLSVWQKSYELARSVYEITKALPPSELYGLSSQMQRAAVSIPSNIAEGQQRNSPKEFKQFLYIARGSAAELSTQLILTQDIYRINTVKLVEDIDEIQRMLYGLIMKL